MASVLSHVVRTIRPAAVGLCALVLSWSLASSAHAQVLQQAVGGVSIDPNGVLSNADTDSLGQLRQLRLQTLEQIPADLTQRVALRKVSLKRLDAAVRQQAENGKPLPDAMKYLAGLQQIEYVFVYPEQNDIVLVGPAEGWKVDARGNLVGASSGRPVMLLDDLLVALRSARQAAQGITCSINPTDEGIARLRALVSKIHAGADPQAAAETIRETLGAQKISVTGVPPTSHFARVLVAADYRMKRLAMNFDTSPVRGLPSFLQMVQTSRHGMSNLMQRWWLEPQYQPVLRDPEGLSWQLRGAAVKALTEEDFAAADGARQHTGRANPAAQKWADNMTAHYAELAVADPIFGQLRNCMEVAIVAALITKENLPGKAGCSLPTLLDPGRVPTLQFPAPRQVESQASLLKKGSNWVISASGGVQINAWGAAGQTQQSDAPAGLRAKTAAVKSDAWWWN